MNRRHLQPAALLVVTALAVGGCAGAGATETAGPEQASSAAPSSASASDGAALGSGASGPASASASPTTSGAGVDSTAGYPGIEVTGEAGSQPEIVLAPGFAPATELGVVDLVEGTGDPVGPDSSVTVQYVGMGQQSRAVFDSSWEAGQPATFALDQVIPGWSEGLVGMRNGGRRLLVIPGSLAYGPTGYPPVIAADETLVFVVDLIDQTP